MRSGPFWLGHRRLAIQDLDARSDQPFRRGSLLLVYNGELWNRDALRAELEAHGETFTTTGDTEVLAAALERWGADALPRLEGMFAFAWTREGSEELFLARDRFGEVPLHAFIGERFTFASEVRAIAALGLPLAGVRWVDPGTLWTVTPRGFRVSRWYSVPGGELPHDREVAAPLVRDAVRFGATERLIGDVSLCVLLSGGIDSSAVLASVAESFPDVVAYTAVLDPKSRDLAAARNVAEALGVELVEVPVPVPTSDDLAGVVAVLELPHKAQVEIGWACLCLADRIASDGHRVVFSGEGSDELWGSYGGWGYLSFDVKGWRRSREESFVGQHRKNFARCNKAFMSRGIECRLPFLSTGLAELALRLPRAAVRDDEPGSDSIRGKRVLQEAMRGLLPDTVIDRPRLAFQTGLGLKDAVAKDVADPTQLYRAAFARAFPGLVA